MNTETSTLRIHLCQPTEAECYGPDAAPEQIAVVAQNCLDLAEAYARREWPEAQITTELVDHALTAAHRQLAMTDGPEELDAQLDILDSIQEFVSRHWNEDALWQPGFSAEGYLDALSASRPLWGSLESLRYEEIAATDLRDEAGTCSATGQDWKAYRLTLRFLSDGKAVAETGTLLWIPSFQRAGIAWGADAVWTYAASPEDTLARYLTDNMIP